jgi:hypothetical protein
MNGYLLEAVGWIGSALLVYSVLQTRFLRFRIVNGIASAVLVAYNAVVGVWPMVGVNAVLVIIDVYFLWTLGRAKRTAKAFTSVRADAALRDWFDAQYGRDIALFHPGYTPQTPCQAAVVFHDGRAIGLVAWRPEEGHAAELLVDYVIPSYRDFAPGSYVYSADGPLRQAGVTTVVIQEPEAVVFDYLTKLGFTSNAPGELSLSF